MRKLTNNHKLNIMFFAPRVLLVTLLTVGAMGLISCGKNEQPPEATVTEGIPEDSVDMLDMEEGPEEQGAVANKDAVSETADKLDEVISEMNDETENFYNEYREEGGEIAYVTGVSRMDDSTYNAAIFSGIKTYAQGAGVTYSYYIPKEDTPEAYMEVVDRAITTGGRLIVCASAHFENIIADYQYRYPDKSFLMIDGIPKDADGNSIEIASNLHCISFNEHESGYLAGYMTVMDGYTKFGFIGGEPVEPVVRYGYGYLQGIDDAAKELGNSKDIEVKYWYSGKFVSDSSVFYMAKDWLTSGTEIIFCCGGSLYESVLSASDLYGGRLIGVDVNQGIKTDKFITSAMKGIDKAVVIALDDYFAFDGWSETLGGVNATYGIKDRCAALPMNPWYFENVTLEQYDALCSQIKDGEIEISGSIETAPETDVKILYYDTTVTE